MPKQPTSFRPEFRPFVLLPAIWASAASLGIALGYLAFWERLTRSLGALSWAGLVAIFLLPLLVLGARWVAFRKTNYTLLSDRIIVHIGALFGDRSVELQLLNITKVEWKSPFLLKKLCSVGHITISEAGNTEQNARLVYVKNPGDIYRLIATNMRAQGFSIERNERLLRQRSGLLGAVVDMGVAGVGVLWALVASAEAIGPLYLVASSRVGSGFARLLSADGGALLEPERLENIQRAVGVLSVLAVGLAAAGALFWAITTFIALTHRTITLYDDVVDYYAGFLSETRIFIPLENLTDTQLIRPIHKRILGLSDLKISARGAGTDMQFQSMPGAQDFARALEKQLDLVEPIALTEKPSASPARRGAESASEAHARQMRAHRFKPVALRAALGPGARALYPLSLILGGLGIPAALGAALNPGALADAANILMPMSFGLLALALIAGLLFATARASIVALATEYSFDGRRAQKTFDFMTRIETKFALDKITMLTILENPLDRLMGTYTIQMHSIGSLESLNFKHIRADKTRLKELMEALSLSPDMPENAPPRMVPGAVLNARGEAQTHIYPKFSLLSAAAAYLPHFLLSAGLAAAGVGALLYYEEPALAAVLAISLSCFFLPALLLWGWARTRATRAELSDEALKVRGGILTYYTKLTAWRHIKSVESIQYPGAKKGALKATVGGGGTLQIPFVRDVFARHEQFNARVLSAVSRPGHNPAGADIAEFQPHPLSEVLYHAQLVASSLLLIPLLPFTMPLVFWRSRRIIYQLAASAIHIERPFLYHRRLSILYAQIDHIESTRTMLNQLFKTRNIEVYTVGAAAEDMVLRGLKAHERVSALIRANTR